MPSAPEPHVDRDRLALLRAKVERDVAAGEYDGATYVVAHRGETVAHEAVGYADRAASRELTTDDVLCLQSIAKPISACLAAGYVDDGVLDLGMPVAEAIPEFAANGKGPVSILHLLTHTSGLSDRSPFDDWSLTMDVARVVEWAARRDRPRWRPGERVGYSPIVAHSVATEAVRRLDGRDMTVSELVRERVLEPAGMDRTTMGRPGERCVPLKVVEPLGSFPAAVIEAFDAAAGTPGRELPAAGMWGTAGDVARFAEAMRRQGLGARARMLSPAMARLAVRDLTGHLPAELSPFEAADAPFPVPPASYGLSFKLRGDGTRRHPYGSLVSPATFGVVGLGSTMMWVDPATDLSFSILTAGLIEETHSLRRFERLSSIVASALVP